MVEAIKKYFHEHWLAFALAFLVGGIYVFPHAWFPIVHNDVYQGIPLMQVDNADYYLARINEVIDGHATLGSPAHFENKNLPPIQPPTAEWLYSLPHFLFGISVVSIFTIYTFLLPALLYFLAYNLLYRLLGPDNSLAKKITAIAGAFFITLGYELINYQHIWALLNGKVEPSSWLLWTRPVNPTAGAIFFHIFLLFAWSVVHTGKRYKASIIGAGVVLGVMFSSYFFSWGVASSILAMTGLIYLLKRNYLIVKRVILVFILGVISSLPYLSTAFLARQNEWYQESLLRAGIFYTHYPILNKLLLVIIVIWVIFVVLKFLGKFGSKRLGHSDWFISAFLLGGLFSFNQQILTGLTVWPFHFVQMTIPVSIMALMFMTYNIFYERWRYVWVGVIGLVVVASVSLGVYTQYKTYSNALVHNKSVQAYAEIFDWLNEQEKDCVVLTSGNWSQFKVMNGMVVAFTHCNQYGNSWVQSLMPYERVKHSLLVNLRFGGINLENLDENIANHYDEYRSYLFSNWSGLYEVTIFPDFIDLILPQRTEQLPSDYAEFLQNDLYAELTKYRLDYILSFGALPLDILRQLPGVHLEKEVAGIFIYSL